MTRFLIWDEERCTSAPETTTTAKINTAAKVRRKTFSLNGPTLNVAAENASELPDQTSAVSNPQISPMNGIIRSPYWQCDEGDCFSRSFLDKILHYDGQYIGKFLLYVNEVITAKYIQYRLFPGFILKNILKLAGIKDRSPVIF
jgi:hypothetical protein